MNTVEIQGIEELIIKLEGIGDKDNIKRAVAKACAFVEGEARENAPKDTGALKASIEYKVETQGDMIIGTVFSPLEYAPYIEYGTGIHAEKQGKQGGWLIPIGNEFTEAKAEKYGYKIYEYDGQKYAFTLGAHPHPFLRPALEDNREKIKKIISEGMKID